MAVHKQVSLPAHEIEVGPDHPLHRAQWLCLGGGFVAILVAALTGWGDLRQFFFSYLVAFLFGLSLALGGLIFVLIQLVTRAGWSVAVRRLAENLMGTLPLFAVLFIPLLAGLHELYSWADPAHVADDAILQAKQAYLNPTFFVVRSLVYLACWLLMALWFRRLSLQQDESGDPRITRKLQNMGAPAIVLFAVTTTFAAFDWIMSLDPHWYSTILGVYFFAGCFVSALSFLILVVILLQSQNLLSNIVNTEHFHDLGKLLFGFVVFWAYIAFSQFMLIWYANIPEETIWFAHRWHHGWEYISIFLAVGHFVIPFFLLISRDAKRSRLVLGGAAIWMLAMHYVDLYWLVMPVLQSEGFRPRLADLLLLVGITGVFFGFFLRITARPALIPKRDPRLAESLSFENI